MKRWQTVRLAEACLIRPPKAEARRKLKEADPVSFLPMENLGIGQRATIPKAERPLSSVIGSYTYFADGDILLAKITPCFENGKLGIARNLKNGVGFGSSEYFVVRPSANVVPEWLFYFFSDETFRAKGAARMTGAVGHKRVPSEFIEEARLPLPPLAEQRRIVSILDEAFAGLDATRANAQKNLAYADALFESALANIFSENGKYWRESTLESVVADDCTLSYGIVQPGEEFADGLLIVRPTDLTSKIVEVEGLKRIDPKLAAGYRRTELQGGDLLLCVRGTTGTLSIAVDELKGANVTRGIVPLRFRDNVIHQSFGYYMMRSETVQTQIQAKTYGTALMQINIADVRKLMMRFPPLTEQATLFKKLQALEESSVSLSDSYRRKIAALDELRKSLLHQAFSGNL